jgi:hypothetical protein
MTDTLPDTTYRLAGFIRHGTNYLDNTQFENVVDLMQAVVNTRHGFNAPLAHGVGNNMTYSFYVRDSLDSVRFYPDGIDGGMVSLRNIEAR